VIGGLEYSGGVYIDKDVKCERGSMHIEIREIGEEF
jgi:hypothetical protein